MADIIAAVVVYNKNCAKALACQSLINLSGIEVLIVDNSTNDFGNSSYCAEMGWRYLCMNGNMGLPKAYNAVFKLLANWQGLIVLLDDDTAIGEGYFSALKEVAGSDQKAQVFLPMVVDDKGILSPCRMKGHRVSRVKDPNAVAQCELTAINSGLALRSPLSDDVRYDEKYFLDYADHAFFRLLRERGITLRLLNITIKQSFFNNQRGNKEAALQRFKTFIPDFLWFCDDGTWSRIYARLYIIKRSVILMLRYSTPDFAWQVFNAFFKAA